jgi:hypothetical protein
MYNTDDNNINSNELETIKTIDSIGEVNKTSETTKSPRTKKSRGGQTHKESGETRRVGITHLYSQLHGELVTKQEYIEEAVKSEIKEFTSKHERKPTTAELRVMKAQARLAAASEMMRLQEEKSLSKMQARQSQAKQKAIKKAEAGEVQNHELLLTALKSRVDSYKRMASLLEEYASAKSTSERKDIAALMKGYDAKASKIYSDLASNPG